LKAWRHVLGLTDDERIQQRLRTLGIEECDLDSLLGELNPDAIEHVERPSWWDICEQVLATASTRDTEDLPVHDYLTHVGNVIPTRSNSMQNEINELRNQVRTLRRMLFGVFGLVVVGGLLAATTLQSVPDVIQAKKFEVVNAEGKVVVRMDSVLHQGTHYGFVTTLNGKGQTLVVLGVTAGEGLVKTENGKGGRLVSLGATTDGNGSVTTENGKGGKLVELGATTDGNGLVETQNGKGQTLVVLGVTTDGEGAVKTENGKGGRLVLLGATTDGESASEQ
jgi:hypothetical protein